MYIKSIVACRQLHSAAVIVVNSTSSVFLLPCQSFLSMEFSLGPTNSRYVANVIKQTHCTNSRLIKHNVHYQMEKKFHKSTSIILQICSLVAVFCEVLIHW